MRRLAAALLLAIVAAGTASAQDTGWTITDFTSSYVVRLDRKIDVVERITVDFGSLQRHGIYREIEIKYKRVAKAGLPIRAGTDKVDLELKGVSDGDGHALQTSVTRGNRIRIRIGDPDVTVTGRQVYVIAYQLERGVGFFDDHDELYWQVTGTNWPVPILHASASVQIPLREGSDTTGWGAWCYAGWFDSSDQSRCSAQMVSPGEYRFSSGRLEPGEGLTMVAGWPKGIVPPESAAEKASRTLGIWWPAALPLLVLGLMFRTWWRRGREPDAGSIVPRWHEPEGLRPGMAGTLVDQSADMTDIVATLLDLAVRGYLVIREVEPDGLLGQLGEHSFIGKALRSLGLSRTDWEIERTDKPLDDLARYEREVLDGVLEGGSSRRMSDMTNDFYKHIPGIDRAMYDEVVTLGLFERSPDGVRKRWALLGGVLLVAGIGIGAVLTNVVLAVGAGLSGAIILAFAPSMPVMTPDGSKRWAELKGLEEYIKRAEKLELEMHQGPAKDVKLFETLLPYAVALDVSEIWVRQFAPILASTPPTWYVGNQMTGFNAARFQQSLGSFTSAATRTMGSSPGSSSGSGGGGSVGGGGGGGGGGSW